MGKRYRLSELQPTHIRVWGCITRIMVMTLDWCGAETDRSHRFAIDQGCA